MNPKAASSEDDDDISITSTVGSEPQSEYEVEAILAQKILSNGEVYLVKWAGYPLERATWEPEESFCDPNTLVEWKNKTASGEHGLLDVDVDDLARRIEEIEAAKFDRHRRRRAKRIRLGIPVSSSSNSDTDLDGFIVGDDIDVEGDGEEEDGQSLRQNQNHLSNNKTQRGERVAVPPSRPGGSSSKSQGSASLVSPSTVFANAMEKRAASPIILPASHRQPTQASTRSSTRKQSSTNLQINPARSQVRPILKLKATSSTGALSDPPQPPVQSQPLSKSTPKEPEKRLTPHSPGPLVPTGQANKAVSIRAMKQNGPNSKPFRNLSSKHRYLKAMRRDLTPDIRQLDLRQPSDWISSPKNKAPVSESPSRPHAAHSSESLFVEQDSPLYDSNDLPSFQRSPTRIDGPANARSSFQPGQAQHASGPRSSKLSHEGSPTKHSSDPTIPSPEFSPNEHNAAGTSGKYLPKRIGSRFRHFQPTEALVHLRFGPEGKEIGDVRLAGLTKRTLWQLVALKSQNSIDIHFKDVCNVDEYRQLCDRRQNIMFCSGWVIGYDDTSSAVNDMANYLRDTRLAALWYHPGEDISSVLVAFASDCPDWSFLNQTAECPSARLRIAVRSSLAPVSSLRPITPKETPDSGNEHNASREDHHFFMNPEPAESIMRRNENEIALSSEPLVGNNGPIDIASVFRTQFDITYDELSIVNTVKRERTARAFYLYFPHEVEHEFQLVLLFLKHYDMVAFSNRVEGDWEKFVKTVVTGTVLFHEKFIHYENMPKLAKLLRASINVFSISLSEPIKNLDYKSHLQRLFPHGGIILMTEDFMLKEPKNALNVLQWFGDFIQRKYPGTWKMFLRPNVQFWLLDLSTSWPDDTLWQMYHTINSLIPDYPAGHYNTYRRDGSPDSLDGFTDEEGQHHPFISTREIPDYGSRVEDDHPNIPRGLTQAERDTDHLVEYFAGYALIHADRFRRFVVLTTHKPQPRWQAWTHIEIMHYPEFKRKLMASSMHNAGDSGSHKDKENASASKSHSKHDSASPSTQGAILTAENPQ
ncbi:hypothetical protein AJ78_07639 [Emergomyces pasteurianus Ep9510]|uniref:Chromo domain-containing protein n=1 Tax=Emergomyces pasteurianus Ep9510 TaxID=1447872 RepID=A0A1J9P6V5_9EURO|nr:hypothetical protein AJ78_07639 [Emergomyces pasteurianus Ep9510]